MLGHEKCLDLHEQTLDTVNQILQAVKWRDVYLYGQVLREILLCAAGNQHQSCICVTCHVEIIKFITF